MAKFNAKGIDGLMLSMQEFAQIPDDVVDDMLDAGGRVTVAAQKQKLQDLGLVKTGKLRDSITAFPKAGGSKNGWKRYVLVYPKGVRGKRRRRKKTKVYKNSRHGRTYTVGGDVKPVTNSEVGFIWEFGAPKRGIKASEWMRLANEGCADAVVSAEMAVYDRWLKSKDL